MKNLKRLFLVSCLALVLAWPTLAKADGDNITVAGEESHDMANDVLLVWVVNPDGTFYQKTIGTPIWSGDLEGFVIRLENRHPLVEELLEAAVDIDAVVDADADAEGSDGEGRHLEADFQHVHVGVKVVAGDR